MKVVCYAWIVTPLLEEALRKLATLSQEDQDAIASQIIETLQDEAAWKERLGREPDKLRRVAEGARQEPPRGETPPRGGLV